MSVGERPELPDNEKTSSARGNGAARGKRGRPRRTLVAAHESDVDVVEESIAPGETLVVTGGGNGGSGGDGGGSRDRSLRRLLAGLRALDAGDFSARVDVSSDGLIAEITAW